MKIVGDLVVPRLPTAEEWESFLGERGAQVLRYLAQKKIAELKDSWAEGHFTYPTIEATHMKNAKALGEVEVWTQLLELDYEKLLSEIGDDFGNAE